MSVGSPEVPVAAVGRRTPGTSPWSLHDVRVRYDEERDSWLVHRPEREWPVPPPTGAIRMPAVPEVLDPDGGGFLARFVPLLGSMGVIAFAFVIRSMIFIVVAGVMVLALVGGGLAAQASSRRRTRERRARTRRDYAAQLAESQRRAVAAAQLQRDALLGSYPDTPGLLVAIQSQGALWERRPEHADFAHVRLGLGSVPAVRPVVIDGDGPPPGAVPEADLARAAHVLTDTTAVVPETPVVLPLRELSSIACIGNRTRARSLAGAWLAGLAASCAPTDLRVLMLLPPSAAADWEWTKWLPHLRDPLGGDGFGRASRAVWTDPQGFSAALRAIVEARLDQRRRAQEDVGWTRGPDGPAVAGEHLLVLIDGYDPLTLPTAPHVSALLGSGASLAATTVLLVDEPSAVPSACGARIDLLPEGSCTYRAAGASGHIEQGVVAERLDREAAFRLARTLAPLQLADADASADLVDTVRLVELLGYESADQLDPRTDVLTEAAALSTAQDTLLAQRLEAMVFGEPPTLGRSGERDPGADQADPEQPARLDRDDLLATPIGVRSDGAPLVLDLKEAAFGGMGPHGVLVGATGSGKSELLRSLVTGLAARHDPALLNMVLVDFKGGATFADLSDLPHTAGLITNLADDLSLADRMRISLAGELDRRQQMLRDAGNVDSLRAYHERRQLDPNLPALPYLLVIVDEFGELLAARPDFLDVFVAIGRLGRSLGIHLLLATQRLDEGRIRGLESHLRYRICLRTYSAGESSTVIGVPDAYQLPPLPGLGYLRVDTDLTRFKAATTMLPHRPVARGGIAPATMRGFPLIGAAAAPVREQAVPGSERQPAAPPETRPELQVLLERLTTDVPPGSHARQVWLPPLPEHVALERVAARAQLHGERLEAQVGLLDDPARQRQDPLVLDLSGAGGHVACVGGPRTGKTTFLRSLVSGLVADRSPEDVTIHLLDLGGGGLHDLADLPHVGAVAGRHDSEAVARMIRELRAVTEERAAAFRACGVTTIRELRAGVAGRDILPGSLAADVVLVIDGLGVLRHEFPELDLELADLAATSLQFGVHLAVSAGRWLDIRPALLDVLGSRVELHLNDPVDSIAGRAVAAALPADRPGRGLLRDGRQVQVATEVRSAAELAEAARARWPSVRAPRILPLPTRVTAEQVPALATAAGRPLPAADGLLLGIAEFRLAPVRIDPLAPGQHLLIYGDSGSGRTTLLRRVISHLCDQPGGNVRLHVVDLSRGLLELADLPEVERYAFTTSLADGLARDLLGTLFERLPPPELSRQQLRDRNWWTGPEHVLVIDDYDLVMSGTTSPLTPMADALGYARDIGFHVVLARRVAGAARSAFEPFGQRLRELTPTAVLLSGERTEGPLVGERAASRMPPGRGLFVRRGQPDALVQLVTDEPGEGQA